MNEFGDKHLSKIRCAVDNKMFVFNVFHWIENSTNQHIDKKRTA